MMPESIKQSIEGNGNNQVISIRYEAPVLLGVSFEDFRVIIDMAEWYSAKCNGVVNVDLYYAGMAVKNVKNNLTPSFYANYLIPESLPHFKRIRDFLTDPRNEEYLAAYQVVSTEVKYYIAENRDRHDTFEAFFTDIYQGVIDNLPLLNGGRKKLVRILLHYMYCDCDIGISHE